MLTTRPRDIESLFEWKFGNKLGAGVSGQVWDVTSPHRLADEIPLVAKVFTGYKAQAATKAEVEALLALKQKHQEDVWLNAPMPPYWFTHVIVEDFMNMCLSYVDKDNKPWAEGARACQYVVLEKVLGGTLWNQNATLAGGKLQAVDVARMCVQVWQGIKALWRVGVSHNDLAPQNLMTHTLEADVSCVRIVDLGYATPINSIDNMGTVLTRSRAFYRAWFVRGRLPPESRMMGRLTADQISDLTGPVTCYTDVEAVIYDALRLYSVHETLIEWLKIQDADPLFVIEEAYERIVAGYEAMVARNLVPPLDVEDQILIAELLHIWVVVVKRDQAIADQMLVQNGRHIPRLPPEGDAFLDVICQHILHGGPAEWYTYIGWIGVDHFTPTNFKAAAVNADTTLPGLWASKDKSRILCPAGVGMQSELLSKFVDRPEMLFSNVAVANLELQLTTHGDASKRPRFYGPVIATAHSCGKCGRPYGDPSGAIRQKGLATIQERVRAQNPTMPESEVRELAIREEKRIFERSATPAEYAVEYARA